jgi:hypothetical protein
MTLLKTYTAVPNAAVTNPWPLPTLPLPPHPRIFLTPTRLAIFRARWANPGPLFAELKNQINGDGQAPSQLIRYLATGDLTQLTACYNTAAATTNQLYGGQYTMYAGIGPFLLDWGYNDLTPTQRATLIAQQEAWSVLRENAASNGPIAGCGDVQGYQAYTMGVLACEGEPGFTSRIETLRSLLQNVCAWIDETMADGHWTGYPIMLPNWMMCVLAYHDVCGQLAQVKGRFKCGANHTRLLQYRVTSGGWNQIAAPSDHRAIGSVASTPNVPPRQEGTIGGQCGDKAYQYAAYSTLMGDGFAQWMANACSGQNMTRKWTDGWESNTLHPAYLAMMLYDPTLPATPPSTLPNSAIFPLPGQVAFRGGWSNPTKTVRGWLHSPLYQYINHDTRHAGCLEIWRGDDMLICNPYTYAGQPCRWQDGNQPPPPRRMVVGDYSMCKSTLLFSPPGSAYPDRFGSQSATMNPASTAAFPIGNFFGGPHTTWLYGTVGNFVCNSDAPGAKAQATADYTNAYYPNSTVTSVQRTVAYVNGADETKGTFFVQDNFTLVPGSVDRIRALWGMRQKPIGMTGETVIAGGTTAGLLTYPNQKVVIQWRNSQATIQMVSPTPTVLRLVGGGHGINGAPAGPGYESYFDGVNVDYTLNGQAGRTPPQEMRINGCWRLECETTPAAANGQMYFAITVGDIGTGAHTYTAAQVLAVFKAQFVLATLLGRGTVSGKAIQRHAARATLAAAGSDERGEAIAYGHDPERGAHHGGDASN